MLGIKRIDHVSVATGDLEGRVRFYKELFAMEMDERFASPADGFKGATLRVPGSDARWELLAPEGEGSFVQRFLDERGPGLHHVTFEVEDATKASAVLREYGIEPFNERTEHGWHQMFIHPRDTGGVLVQLYEVVGEDDTILR